MTAVCIIIIIAVLFHIVIHGFRSATPTYIGDVGEARVSKRLRKLNEDEYKVLNNIIVMDSEDVTTQIDHIVVSTYGIFVIETKCYKGWIFGAEKSRVWTQSLCCGRGWRSSTEKHTFQNPIRQNWRHICVLSEQLKIPCRYFHNVVVFAGEAELKTELPENVMHVEDVVPYIRSFTVPMISEENRDQLTLNVLELAVSVSNERIANHGDMLHELHAEPRSVQANASVPSCPKCGALMRLRYRYKDDAPFIGCSRYPNCKGIVNIVSA